MVKVILDSYGKLIDIVGPEDEKQKVVLRKNERNKVWGVEYDEAMAWYIGYDEMGRWDGTSCASTEARSKVEVVPNE